VKPRLLDAFCGAGGAARGYQRAGFHVVGVDIEPQPDYCGDEFYQMDALVALAGLDGWDEPFDAIHASPPCHDHSTLSATENGTGWLLAATVALLAKSGLPWVCENVVGPDVKMAGWWFVLCGSSFDMKVRRHRRFGSSLLMLPPACRHKEQGRPYTVTGHGGGCESRHSLKPKASDFWRYMDMPWMEGKPPYGVAQAIPPAYTEFIGAQLLAHIESERVA
jgi:DNA (cytosine-5)-methyltransferase 1